MDCLDTIRVRVQEAADLAALLGAAHGAFAALVPVTGDQQDPASPWFTGFVMAGACAASGRLAVTDAPSFPAAALARAVPRPSRGPAGQAAAAVIALAQVLAARLDDASLLARQVADRHACGRAAGHARDLCASLGGAPPP